MSRPHLSPSAFDDPEAEIARLMDLLALNMDEQRRLDSPSIVLSAESGRLIGWITALMTYREHESEIKNRS